VSSLICAFFAHQFFLIDFWKIEFRAVYLLSFILFIYTFSFEFVIKKGRGFAPDEALATAHNKVCTLKVSTLTICTLFENGANSRPFNNDGKDDRKNMPKT
jgi:hypothetical protein